MKNAPNVENNASILTLTDKTFRRQVESGITLVDFWASWCVPCKIMAPILKNVAVEIQNKSTKIAKIDIEKYPSIARQYTIRNIPTLIIFKNGKEMTRMIGLKSKGAILNELGKY